MNDFRVNPERPCKRSSSLHAGVGLSRFPRSPFSLSLHLRSRELPFRTFYFLNNAGTERGTGGGEGKREPRHRTSWPGPGWTFSRANHVGHTLRVGRYVTAAGTGSSINLDHGVISPSRLLSLAYHATNPGERAPSTVNARIIYGERDASMLLIYVSLIRRDLSLGDSASIILQSLATWISALLFAIFF